MHFYGTIGPACASAGTLRRLVDAGMTGLRMNLSHGALAEHTDISNKYRSKDGKSVIKHYPGELF